MILIIDHNEGKNQLFSLIFQTEVRTCETSWRTENFQYLSSNRFQAMKNIV
jgi:hypothetical protein